MLMNKVPIRNLQGSNTNKYIFSICRNSMTKTRKNKTKKTRRQQFGGFRRVRVTFPMPIWNVKGTKMNPKDYIKEGELYGIDKASGDYLIYIDKKLIKVDQSFVTFLNSSKSSLNKTCATCGRNPQKTTQADLLASLKNKKSLHIPQNSYTIQSKSIPITTTGLATCTALTMVIGDKRFFAHISALSDISLMLEAIVETIREQRVRPSEVKVWLGLGGSSNNINTFVRNDPTKYSLDNVKKILSALEIPIESVEIEDTCFAEVVGV